METPEWALEIVAQVCLENNREVPELRWGRRKLGGIQTSGRYRPKEKKISISVGIDNHEKQVLLHELVHVLMYPDKRHNSSFYILHKKLLVQYDCLTEEFKQQEGKLRKAALLYL